MRQAFFSIFNRRVFAAVMLISLLMALSRALSWMPRGDSAMQAWFKAVLGLSGLALLPGGLMLLGAATAEACLAGWRRAHRSSARAEWVFRIAWVALGVALALLLRFAWIQFRQPDSILYWGFFVTRWAMYSLLGSLAYAVLVWLAAERDLRERLSQAQAQSQELRTRQMEAQLAALNAQIEPHFLFNTLATTRRLYASTPDRGRDMLGHLIAYLRATLPALREPWSSLGQELDLLRNYLAILQMRMGERLRFEIKADPSLLSLRLPPLILATLVENAIKHGLGPLSEGGRIEIVARRESTGPQAETLLLEVRDDGAGFVGSSGSGVGLANTRARLLAYFGPQARLELETLQPRGVLARIVLPGELAQ
ncbi:sensor histidine kinase [Paucibacter sp. Y2R2-4]|uniref:sensor histidine kinase n=1 Tax=Paucibacter sp. Y2R2-4 TaxID=2893553 RepID=UPI0021E434E9|nr:histidine kinase [Paucibacter sp. Y2R2-4]MCV2351003.1 histidine kinase [Paucibacter sp. Y2R2-4]